MTQRLTLCLLASLMAAFAQSCWSLEVEIQALSPYDEFVDRGLVTISAAVTGYPSTKPTAVLDCNAISTSFVGSTIHFDLMLKAGDQPQPPCFGRAILTVGPLHVGTYLVTAHLADDHGLTVSDAQIALNVLPVAGRCNAHPQILPQIIALLASGSPTQFQQRVLNDPSYAALVGNPVVQTGSDFVTLGYPPLVNPTELQANLEDTGQFSLVEQNQMLCSLSRPSTTALATEFFNAELQHYFYTSDPNEKAVLDSGVIAGWSETGESFLVTTSRGCNSSDPSNAVVYRFYGLPSAGTGTHFLTANRNECYIVDHSKQWLYEGIAFWAAEVSSDGSCPANLQPLYRAWRPFGDSEHRYSTKPTVVAEMAAQGWTVEGAVMCVHPH